MYRQSVLLCSLALTSSCVAYVRDDADPATIAAQVLERDGGAFTFDEAVATAYRQNPELRALAAQARAAGADLEPFEIESEYRSGSEMLAVMVDPIALLDLGPRGTMNDALDSAAAAAAIELVTQRWRVAGEIAEVFAVDAVLGELTVPEIRVDADAFERAGLASTVAAARVRAALAEAEAERAVLHAEREGNLVRLRRLLGLPGDAAVTLRTSPTPTPVRSDAAILARPDLTLATARFRLADAEFHAAVAAQYPSLMIGPEFPISGGALEWMAVLRLPIGATGKAKAAAARRDAARAELEASYLDATREVRDAELKIAMATAEATAAKAAYAASADQLTAALATLKVDVDAFAMVAEAASMAIRETRARRVAELARRVAQNDLDVAYGWPTVVPAAREGS